MSTSLPATSKYPCDRHQHDRAQRRRRNAVDKAAAKNAQLRENPSSQNRADQSEYDVCNAAEAPAARNFSRKPAGNESYEDPSDEGTWDGEKEKVHEVLLSMQASSRRRATRPPKQLGE